MTDPGGERRSQKIILPAFRLAFIASDSVDMDRKLLDLLVCPTTRQPLGLLDSRGLQAANGAIAMGGIVRADGSPQSDALREALVTRDRKTLYRVDDGIPVLLAEEAISTAQIEGFPRA